MEDDLGTRLDWDAAAHFNVGHPHSHIVIRGADDTGKEAKVGAIAEVNSIGLTRRMTQADRKKPSAMQNIFTVRTCILFSDPFLGNSPFPSRLRYNTLILLPMCR